MHHNITYIALVAVDENLVIGHDNQLIWHLPNDLKRFKKLTTGYPMVMGRKTYESLGSKPLPGRDHIVISSQVRPNAERVFWFQSVENALQKAAELSNTVYIIGGGEIFRQTMPRIHTLELTRVHHSFTGDVHFPDIDFSEWERVWSEHHPADDKHPYPFTFETYKRIPKPKSTHPNTN
ncbi:MAG: dihydrofolate reductase [Weeksellaceae bacterium]|nr:dihydrofolate reductase [Weeksellaceae bacterium]